jgi:predicted Zn-dependent protease
VTRWNRREVLAGLGVATAAALAGCGGLGPRPRAPRDRGEVRGWLHDAVARLVGAFPEAAAHAVSVRRTVAASDVVGDALGHGASDGALLVVRDRDGRVREEYTDDLSGDGVRRALEAITDGRVPPATARAFTAPPPLPTIPSDPVGLGDRGLAHRMGEVRQRLDRRLTSRAIYHGVRYELDDTTRWSVTETGAREERLVRVLHTLDVVGWSGTRLLVGRAHRGWRGGLDRHRLADDDLDAAIHAATEVFTPGGLAPTTTAVILDPSLAAALATLLAARLLNNPRVATPSPAPTPDLAAWCVAGAKVASPHLTLRDDPTAADAYAGFGFDDEGTLAAPLTLLDAGQIADRLADRAAVRAGAARVAGRGLRAGHLGELAISSSHLRITPGTRDRAALLAGDALILEGARAATLEPDREPGRLRLRLAAARAREIKAGQLTGRVFPEVELVGELATLLGDLEEPGAALATIAERVDDPRGRGGARWRSVEAPHLRTRGLVRPRQGIT